MSEIIQDAKSRAIRITSIVRKELKSLISDKAAITVLFLVPVVLISILGVASPSLSPTRVWIIDLDQTEKSAEFIATLKNSSNIIVYATGDMAPVMPEIGQSEEDAYAPVTLENAQKAILTEYLDAYIVLPEGMEESIKENGTCKIEIYYDSIDILGRFFAESMIKVGITNVQLNNLIFEADVIAFPQIRPKEYGERKSIKDVNTLEISAPLGIPLMLYFGMQMIAAQSIVGDKPLKRLLNTSLRRGEVVTGKIISYTILGFFQVILTMLLVQAFGIQFHCLWIDLFFIYMLLSVDAITMGVFISTISKSRLQAAQIFLFMFFLMYVNINYIRNTLFLKFTPLEQAQLAYLSLAARGLDMSSVISPIFYLILTFLIFYLMTLVYIKYIKKEFV